MEQSIFRKSSIERVSSPEQLNDYIKVTNPGVWLVLGAVIALLIGACVWGVTGRLETTVSVPTVVSDGEARLFLEEGRQVDPDATVVISGKEYALGPVSESGAYLISVDLPDGDYQATVVTERISPLSFVLN